MTGPRSQVEGDDEVWMLLDSPDHIFTDRLHELSLWTINGKVYKLLKAMYGLRDAGAAFDRKVFYVTNLMGSVSGQVQHLCWTQEGAGHVGQIGALG